MLISQAFIRKPNILASGACLKRLLNIPAESYLSRHIGPRPNDIKEMLKTVGFKSIDEFVEASMPSDVLVKRKLNIIPADGFSEQGALARLKQLAGQNKVVKSLIGRGYYGTVTPSVILRSVLENPNWYTSYTPYQPEISQGRLESLFNFQTVICDLTGMEIANASLLDEATAAAEAMSFSFHHSREKKPKFLVDINLFEQTVDVIKTRAQLIGVQVEQTDLSKVQKIDSDVCGVLVGYPSADGSINDWKPLADLCKQGGVLVSVAADLLALAIMEPPKYADVVVGTSQRLGVPMGFGGPHAGYFATKNAFSRKIPGRIIGVSKDKHGDQAYRLALQTREQHIRREKATSNICTAQALLANITAMYAVYHGPQGLKDIATKIHLRTRAIASLIGESLINRTFFDTLSIKCENSANLQEVFLKAGFNIYVGDAHTIGISLDESLTDQEFEKLYKFIKDLRWGSGSSCAFDGITAFRESKLLQYPVFNSHHSETEMLRYISKLQSKDFSLAQGMIPLGSCTMKLNAATAMIPITWPEFANIHPFAPQDQTYGYLELIKELENDLSEITGFAATSLQPNSGAQGEFSGLRAIRLYLDSIGETSRNVCLIPVSAHGTNPASASLAGMKIVSVKCLPNGELDLKDLEAKADKHAAKLAAMMITYPSTYGVYELGIRKAISIIHNHGGQVYMDGANMNAQVGLTSPGDLGADVCHLNLHKTFSIPHGGGGPGVGPICVKEHLVPFLPNHSVKKVRSNNLTSVSAAPYGSALVLPISWSYIKMLGPEGLKTSSQVAMLNANYLMKRLEPYYEVVFKNSNGLCAHEFIMNLGNFKTTSGVQTIDIAKRLQDYGFHGPTMSWPVPNTLMIEPTESESKQELDRFVDALISIRQEIADIEAKKVPYENGVLANAPHTTKDLLSTKWDRSYTREQAAFPVSGLKQFKFWPASARVDDTYGDKNLICSCGSVENYTE